MMHPGHYYFADASTTTISTEAAITTSPVAPTDGLFYAEKYLTPLAKSAMYLNFFARLPKERSDEPRSIKTSHLSFADVSTTATTTPVAPTYGLLLCGEMIGIPNDDN